MHAVVGQSAAAANTLHPSAMPPITRERVAAGTFCSFIYMTDALLVCPVAAV